MQRLSSRSTFFYKRIFPLFLLGLVGIGVAVAWVVSSAAGKRPEAWLSVLPALFMAVVGWVIYKTIIADLVDEVWLAGDHLLVRNRDDQVSVALDNVMNVNVTSLTNPPRISLTLRTESSRLGKTVTFVPDGPRGLFGAFKANPVATQLIECVDEARRRKA
ncbi:hypothetical protein [Dyella japonica]|uniref:Uncharacterized protein n=1 Tax=Dyella japonica A8 TaxID=1217721 RepID=A0A075K3H1_9GAMM|nr:hypothetical protein [Dyella japonica]AIF46728.1 hypothetical protein HY57_05365 [Dyella japonica A8]